MAIHDCDILTYDREMLARLVYPVSHPTFSYQLSKGFYPRVGEGKLNGRVTRLLVSPLLIALKKVIGDRDYIEYLRSLPLPAVGRVRDAHRHDAGSAHSVGLGAGDRRAVGGLAQFRAAMRSARWRSPTATTTSTRR
jgi:hypothetical protein